jgi:hypothetical protein
MGNVWSSLLFAAPGVGGRVRPPAADGQPYHHG